MAGEMRYATSVDIKVFLDFVQAARCATINNSIEQKLTYLFDDQPIINTAVWVCGSVETRLRMSPT